MTKSRLLALQFNLILFINIYYNEKNENKKKFQKNTKKK